MLSLAVFWTACQSKPAAVENTATPATTATPAIDNSINTPKFKVKDKSQYSARFLAELQDHVMPQNGEVSLDGNTVIFHGDRMMLSPFNQLNETIVLKGNQNNINIELSIKAVNYSSIEYTMLLQENGKSHTSSGQAHVPATFFLGSESIENPADGISILAHNFSIDAKDDCYGEITIAKDEKTNKFIGKIFKNCNGKLSELDQDNSPFLSE